MTQESSAGPRVGPSPAFGSVAMSSDHLLVVEDDPYLRRVLVRTLQNWGFFIREAVDGGAAIDQVEEAGDDLGLILLDIMLPVLNGVEVARKVLHDHPNLRIVACSAAMNDKVEAELREVGVRHFLPKPYTVDSLRESLRSALNS